VEEKNDWQGKTATKGKEARKSKENRLLPAKRADGLTHIKRIRLNSEAEKKNGDAEEKEE